MIVAPFRYDIAVLRLLAITIVVGFHIYGMCYAEAHLPSPIHEHYKDMYEWFNGYVPINVAMPLFVFISGFLYSVQLSNRKYCSLWEVAKLKFLRVGVPFYVFMVIMMATYSGFSISPFYTGYYWHLWFLPMLWWMFVCTYLLKGIITSPKRFYWYIVVCVAYVMPLFGQFLPHIFGLQNLSGWYCFFLLGVSVQIEEERMDNLISRYCLLPLFLLIYVITIVFFPTEYGRQSISLLLGSTMAVLSLWYLFRRVLWERFFLTSFMLFVSKQSFGIYIFHYWIGAFLISSTAMRWFPIVPFAERHDVLFPFLFAVLTFVASFALSKLLAMTRLGRKLIG